MGKYSKYSGLVASSPRLVADLAAQHVISQSSVVPSRAFEALLPLTAVTIGAPTHRPLLIPVAILVGLALAAWSRRNWISSSGIEDDDWRRLLLGLAFGYRLRRRLVPRLRIALECQAWLRRLLLGFGSGLRRRRRLPGIWHRSNWTRSFGDFAPTSSKPPDENAGRGAANGEYRYCEG